MWVELSRAERISVLPQGEPGVQSVPKHRPRTLVLVHTGRGRPRNPPRQGGPTESRDYTPIRSQWDVQIDTLGGRGYHDRLQPGVHIGISRNST